MIYLAYGLNAKDELIHVSESKRGKTALACPYCGGRLTAKKGRVKAHHFAHSGATCQTSINYDFYDLTKEAFPLDLGLYDYAIQRKEEMEQQYAALQQKITALTEQATAATAAINEAIRVLQEVSKPYKNGNRPKNRQQNSEVLQQLQDFLAGKRQAYPEFHKVRHSVFSTYYEVSFHGSEPVFYSRYAPNEIWQYRFKHFIPDDLVPCFKLLINKPFQTTSRLAQLQEDLASFKQEQERFQQFTLYFLELRTDNHIYHKIGITGRTVKERVAEVEQDARKLGHVHIIVKHQVKGYAFLETFFKHKYANYQLEFGQYTEYFDLPADILKGIEEDLNRLEYLSLDRIDKIKAGMQKAKAQGKHVGRPAEQEKTQEFLQKPKSQEILTLLQQGFALREIERQTGYAINTIRKVKQFAQSEKS